MTAKCFRVTKKAFVPPLQMGFYFLCRTFVPVFRRPRPLRFSIFSCCGFLFCLSAGIVTSTSQTDALPLLPLCARSVSKNRECDPGAPVHHIAETQELWVNAAFVLTNQSETWTHRTSLFFKRLFDLFFFLHHGTDPCVS